MLNRIVGILYSTRTMATSIILFAISMAVATFIENDFGTEAAKDVIYGAKWFEFLMLLLVINFIGNIFNYRLYRWKKLPVFIFHLAFIITLIGAFVTRYYSFEGTMPIREGSTSSTIYSDKTYLNIRVDNNSIMRDYEQEVLFSQLTKPKFKISEVFGMNENHKIPFTAEVVDFVPHAMESLVHDEKGEKYIHLVESGSGIRKDIFLKKGEMKNIRNVLFTFNNPVEGGMNFFDENGEMSFQAGMEGKLMDMVSQEMFAVYQDSIAPLHLKQLYSFDRDLRFVIPEVETGKVIKDIAPKDKFGLYPYDAVTLKIKSGEEEKLVEVRGASSIIVQPEKISLNGLNFAISYGSKEIKTPFSIELRDFEMERYPGTNSASSYASEVTVHDGEKSFDFRIYMNHVLDYKGYRFYQASYDKDEMGTILSVNHDYLGTMITYLGYILLGLGMFVSLFWKGTRFDKLSKKIKAISTKRLVSLVLFIGLSTFTIAQDGLSNHFVSKEHADKFGRLLIQDHQGRIKPINTYALETLRKVYKKDSYKGLTAEQVLLSAQLDPSFWSHEYLVKVHSTVLGSKICNDLNVKDNYTNLTNFFVDNKYYLEDLVSESFRKKKSNRNTTDNEIINLDERANIWLNSMQGSLMNIYPKNGDPNNKWFTGFDQEVFIGEDTIVMKMHQLYMFSLKDAIASGDYTEADRYLGFISEYQKKLGSEIMPSDKKIDLEIKYNRWSIFKKLMFYYMIVGFIFLIFAFADLFKPGKKMIKLGLNLMTVLTIIGMIAHVIGMGVRWYLSGHEPWSNGYEAVVFVAWVTILAGVIFSVKNSKFTLAATVLFASFLMGIAHGSMMNPEMTNLVPVLKSYWLMIHVAIITSSYGFLGLGALLGFFVLLLYILRTKSNAGRLDETIKELTYINESTLTVGIYTLTLGTFLGGVWANESWGRYWSWDPKEVWSLISMMVYVFVLHMRIVPGLRGKFAFNLASMFSIGTLIMTFFGVNYYLSGMHSYAAGDPVPIPSWVYFAIVFFVAFSILSYIKYRSFQKAK